MAESTKDERDRMRGLIGHGIHENGTAAKCLRDADRLARLEDGIRALADELQGEVEQHDPNKSFDEYSGGLADKAEMVEDRLRTLLDGE